MKIFIITKAILILIFLFSNLELTAQQEDFGKIIIPDTVCFKYNFLPGDTLTYRVEAHDSIIIDYSAPLLRKRFERWMVVCDSVNKNKRIFLTISMTQFLSYESRGKIENVKRENSPWLNRKIQIEIDTLGKRYKYKTDDSEMGAATPGGAFQPTFILPFSESCKLINQSWLVSNYELELIENSIPPAVTRSTFLFRNQEPLDTLDYECSRFSYIETGQAMLNLETNEENISYSAIINAHGILTFSKEFNIPVHFYSTHEQKLTIASSDGKNKPGWHYIDVKYTLDEFKHSRK